MKKYCDGPIFLRAVKATVKVTQVPYLIVSGVWRDYSPGAQLSVEIRIVRCQMSTLKLTLRLFVNIWNDSTVSQLYFFNTNF